jgi:hypothetical protein
MTETTTTHKPPPTQPPCTICGATDHTNGFHDSVVDPAGFHDSSIDDTTGFHDSSVPTDTNETK